MDTKKPVVHCKYIRPDYDGTLAIHSSTVVLRTMSVVRTTTVPNESYHFLAVLLHKWLL